MLEQCVPIDVLAPPAQLPQPGAAQLPQPADEAAASGEMQDKFSQDARGMLEYGNLKVFFRGLEGLVGSPNPNVMAAMAEEDAALGQSSGDMRPGTAAGEMGMGGMGGAGGMPMGAGGMAALARLPPLAAPAPAREYVSR